MEQSNYVSEVMKSRVQERLATFHRLDQHTRLAISSQIISADMAGADDDEAIEFMHRVQSLNGWTTMPTVDQLVHEYESMGLDLTETFEELDLTEKYELHPSVANSIQEKLKNRLYVFSMAVSDLMDRHDEERYIRAAHLVDSMYSLVNARDTAKGIQLLRLKFEVLERIEIPFGWGNDKVSPMERFFYTAEEFADYIEGRTEYRPKQIDLSDIEL